jgi:hypothetical protein
MSWKGYSNRTGRLMRLYAKNLEKFDGELPEVKEKAEKTKNDINSERYSSMSNTPFTNKLDFGKYSGMCAEDIAKIDPGYIVEVLDNNLIKNKKLEKLFRMWYRWAKEKIKS